MKSTTYSIRDWREIKEENMIYIYDGGYNYYTPVRWRHSGVIISSYLTLGK